MYRYCNTGTRYTWYMHATWYLPWDGTVMYGVHYGKLSRNYYGTSNYSVHAKSKVDHGFTRRHTSPPFSNAFIAFSVCGVCTY